MSRRLILLQGIAAAACCLAVFLYFAGPALWGGFMPDDLMNLHRAARTPALQLVQATLTPWVGDYRPFGFLFFKGFYASFGFNPLPYHAIGLTLIGANVALIALLAWRLTASGAAAALTALLTCHHGYFSDLYLNTGTMFDTLAATLCLALLHSHLSQPRPGWTRMGAQLLAFLLALQIKEIVIFLPAALWGYELLIRREPGAWRKAHQAWAMTALAAVFAAGFMWNDAEVAANAEYRASFSPGVLLDHWEHYLALMFYQQHGPGTVFTLAILGAAAAAALLSRDRAACWAWLLAMTAPLPLLSISPRSFYAFYLPYLFWALLGGIVLARLTRWWRWGAAAVFVPLVAALIYSHAWIRPYAEKWHSEATEHLRPALELLAPEARTWPRGAVVVFTEDPYPRDDYTLLYVATLAGGDLSLVVHRVKAGARDEDPRALRYAMTGTDLKRLASGGVVRRPGL